MIETRLKGTQAAGGGNVNASQRGESARGRDFAALLGGAAQARDFARQEAPSSPAPAEKPVTAQDSNAATAPRGLDVARRRHELNATRQQAQRERVDAQQASRKVSEEDTDAPAAQAAAASENDASAVASGADAKPAKPARPQAAGASGTASGAAKNRPAEDAETGDLPAAEQIASDAGNAVPSDPELLASEVDALADEAANQAADALGTAAAEAADPAASTSAAHPASPSPADPLADPLAAMRGALRLAAAATDPTLSSSETSAPISEMPLRVLPEMVAAKGSRADGLLTAIGAGAQGAPLPTLADGLPGGGAALGAALAALAPGRSAETGVLPGNELALTASGATAAPAHPFASLLTAAADSMRPAAAGAPVAAPPMNVPPEHPDFVDALGERIVWVTDSGLSNATIDMNPQELGALRVQVQLRGSEAQVAFSADNPATRAMLAATLPQLRELFAGQGLQLLRSQVESRSGVSAASRDGGADTARGRVETTARARVTRVQIVDAYV